LRGRGSRHRPSEHFQSENALHIPPQADLSSNKKEHRFPVLFFVL